MTNIERANAARNAVEALTLTTYAGRTPEALGAPTVEEGIAGARVQVDSDAETMIGDLLCDLRHYCRAIGLDWDAQIDKADWHYAEESQLDWDEE